MKDNTYNGWTNYETWQAALWLGEADYYGLLLERWEESGEVPIVDSEELIDFVEEVMLTHEREGLLGDILTGWIHSVNWREIATHYNDDLEREE